jgi:hypothetical protein
MLDALRNIVAPPSLRRKHEFYAVLPPVQVYFVAQRLLQNGVCCVLDPRK